MWSILQHFSLLICIELSAELLQFSCEDSLNEHSFEILIKFCIQFLFLFEMFSQIGESTVEFGVTGLLSNKYFLFSEYGIFRTKRRKNYTLLHIFTEIKTLN
jgi:hypothetical protein